jgi:hypothetical protein
LIKKNEALSRRRASEFGSFAGNLAFFLADGRYRGHFQRGLAKFHLEVPDPEAARQSASGWTLSWLPPTDKGSTCRSSAPCLQLFSYFEDHQYYRTESSRLQRSSIRGEVSNSAEKNGSDYDGKISVKTHQREFMFAPEFQARRDELDKRQKTT